MAGRVLVLSVSREPGVAGLWTVRQHACTLPAGRRSMQRSHCRAPLLFVPVPRHRYAIEIGSDGHAGG